MYAYYLFYELVNCLGYLTLKSNEFLDILNWVKSLAFFMNSDLVSIIKLNNSFRFEFGLHSKILDC